MLCICGVRKHTEKWMNFSLFFWEPKTTLKNKVLIFLKKALNLCVTHSSILAFPGGASGKESPCQCRRHKRRGFHLWIRMIPWSRKWPHAPIFLLGKCNGQRSLANYSPWDHKESDMTERLNWTEFNGISYNNYFIIIQLLLNLMSYFPK